MAINLQLFDQIDKTISPNDGMYQGNQDHYFYVGYSALNCINNALIMTGKDPSKIKNILDLPSGYGRVLRWIATAFSGAEITACDLDVGAVNFCSEHIAAKKLYSNADPDLIDCEDTFDLIWCGSLFTHLESKKWKKFLTFFDRKIKPDGILLFTTHGPYVSLRMTYGIDYGINPDQINQLTKHYNDSGFGFENYNWTADYGISIAKPSFTLKLLEAHTDFNLIFYQEKGWDHHQDVIACQKDSHFREKAFSYNNEFKQLP
jgi:2-polyprenyl-3-methyl-5-hydroxy-6-metoxy-1,4-benzoquinol methylase